MKFIIYDNDRELNCNIITTYLDPFSKKSYVIYTDGSLNDKGLEEIYASRYTMENSKMILLPIENEEEWDMLDKVLTKGENL